MTPQERLQVCLGILHDDDAPAGEKAAACNRIAMLLREFPDLAAEIDPGTSTADVAAARPPPDPVLVGIVRVCRSAVGLVEAAEAVGVSDVGAFVERTVERAIRETAAGAFRDVAAAIEAADK